MSYGGVPELPYRIKSYAIFAAVIIILASGCVGNKTAQRDDSPVIAPLEGEQTSDDMAASIVRARDMVLSYFIPLGGDIEGMENGHVRIRVGEDGPVKKGMRFSVFRESGPFYHPLTNELIGNAEEPVGRIEIVEDDASDGVYAGRIINGDIRAGDRARISSSDIKLAFFQDRKATWNVSETFYRSLKESGRFALTESYAPDNDAETVSQRAGDLGTEVALLLSTPVKDEKKFLNIKLYWVEDVALVEEIEEETGPVAAGFNAPDEESISTFKETKQLRRFKLPGGLLIALGDVDGNGADEFVISDGRDIRIYSAKDEFREMWHIKAEGEGRHLSLDVLDVNNNGRAEIFVTSALNAGTIFTGESSLYEDDIKLNSFVIEYDPMEGYKRIEKNMGYFLRVTGRTLLMQRFNNMRIFSGPVYKGQWKEKHYTPGEKVPLPEMANIYGFTYVDWHDSGKAELMTYDNNGYLFLYDENGNLKWRSDSSYGPFTFSFESRTRSVVNPTIKWSVRGRLATVKTERGQEVIAVNRKPVLAGVPGLGVREAGVYSLWWDGSEMEKKPLLSEVPGAVTDYLIQGRELFLFAKGDFFTFLSNITEGEFKKVSVLYYYIFAPLEKGH